MTAPRPNFLDSIFGAPTPELTGVLGPDVTPQARRAAMLQAGIGMLGSASAPGGTLGGSIAAGFGAGQQGYQDTIKTALQSRQFGQQQEMMQKRAAIAQKYPAVPGETPDQTNQRLRQMLAGYIGINDMESAKSLSEYLKSVGDSRAPAQPKSLITEKIGNKVYLIDPITGQTVREITGPAEARSDDATQQQMVTRGLSMWDDYRMETKDISQAASQYRTLLSAADGARRGDPAAQIAMVFSYMKTLDPTSVVRESEYATAENARGVPETIRNQYNKVLKGSRLTPQQVNSFVAQASATAKGWKQKQNVIGNQYRERAASIGINPRLVAIDYWTGLEDAPSGRGQSFQNVQSGARSTARDATDNPLLRP